MLALSRRESCLFPRQAQRTGEKWRGPSPRHLQHATPLHRAANSAHVVDVDPERCRFVASMWRSVSSSATGNPATNCTQPRETRRNARVTEDTAPRIAPVPLFCTPLRMPPPNTPSAANGGTLYVHRRSARYVSCESFYVSVGIGTVA